MVFAATISGRDGFHRGSPARVFTLLVVFVVLASSACGRGIATPPDEATAKMALALATGSAVQRHSVAPSATPAQPVGDPRCRAVQTLFLRAAVDPRPATFVVNSYTQEMLDQVEVLVSGQSKTDLDALRKMLGRFQQDPARRSAADTEASTAVLNRLLVWAVSTCPPVRPVWGCADPVAFGTVNRPFFVVSEADGAGLAPEDAVGDRLGEISGNRVELARNRYQVVYGYLDGFQLVRRRVAVSQVDDLWYVSSAAMCDDTLPLTHPFDSGVPFVEELPDIGDGPEYAPTTTTIDATIDTTIDTTTTTPEVTSTTIPVTPCGYDPTSRVPYKSLGDYMKNGPAEPDCWRLLTAAGKACVSAPPKDDLFACFNLK